MTTDDRFAAYTTDTSAPAAAPTGGSGVVSTEPAAPPTAGSSRFDDGFFAGPARPATGQFGVPAQASPPAAPSAFGPPFGSPVAAHPSTAGHGPTNALPAPEQQTSSGKRALRRIGVTLGILVVLGGFGMGRFGALAGFLAGDMTVPASLAGMAPAADASSQSVARSIEADLEERNSGDAVVQVYADGTRLLFFVGQRTRTDLDREFADAGITSFTTLGDNSCGTAPDGTSMCMRTSRSTTVGVGGNSPVEQVSAALDEAWNAQ